MFIGRTASRLATRTVDFPRLLVSVAAPSSASLAPTAAGYAANTSTLQVVWLATRGISSDLRAKLEKERDNFLPIWNSNVYSRAVAEGALKIIADNCGLESNEEALAVLTIFFQRGGTASYANGDTTVFIFGKSFTLDQIRGCFEQASIKGGERRLARTYQNEIHEIASILGVPGNRYRKVQKSDYGRKFVSLHFRTYVGGLSLRRKPHRFDSY